MMLICCGSIFFMQQNILAQELYVFTEPASNMPAGSLGLKYEGKFLKGYHTDKLEQRHMLELHAGLSKKWMLDVGATMSDMYSPNIRFESVNFYTKYRFYSDDQVHRHFRAAAFVEGSWSRNNPFYDEIAFDGDQSGIRGGFIFTQLLHKLAISSTLSLSEVLHEKRFEKVAGPQLYPWQSFNYSLSAGYLLFPRNYVGFNQTNFNLYLELLGSNALDKSLYYVDLAPAIQFIFNSNTKLNAGYRFQLGGNMHRMAEESWTLSLETTFLNALKKKS
jgi:hypothetical protein